jgi:hypothetical protein
MALKQFILDDSDLSTDWIRHWRPKKEVISSTVKKVVYKNKGDKDAKDLSH